MCGIIGVFNYGDNKEIANEKTLEIFQDQRSRGTEGFGAIFIDDKNKITVKRATHETKMLVDVNLNASKMILLHHRQPTSSSNKIQQTHPIMVENKKLKFGYLVMHNGIIRNHKELKEQHEKEGFKYTTDDSIKYNDSESVAIEIAKVIESLEKRIKAHGSCAFLALQYDPKTSKALNVFYGRNEGSQLKIAKSRNLVRISSEAKGDMIKQDTLYHFNLEDFNIKKQDLIFEKEVIIETKEIGFQSICSGRQDYGTYPGHRQSSFQEKEFTPKRGSGYNEDYDCDVPTTEYELSEKMDDNSEIINEELSDLLKRMSDETTFWSVKIDEEIKNIVGVTILELRMAYADALDFYSKEAMKNAEQDIDKGMYKKEEIKEMLGIHQNVPEKLYSR